MRIDNHNPNPKNKVEVSQQKKQQIEYELIGNITPHKNHKMWEINNKTLEIKEATFVNVKTRTVVVKFGISFEEPVKEILQKKGFTYVSALNKQNALNKFKQGKNGTKEVVKNKWKL